MLRTTVRLSLYAALSLAPVLAHAQEPPAAAGKHAHKDHRHKAGEKHDHSDHEHKRGEKHDHWREKNKLQEADMSHGHDREGREIQGLRVIGFQSADRFVAVLDQALNLR